MATVLLVCVVVLIVAALVFGIVSLLTGEDPGLAPTEADGRALPLPNHRSLAEADLKTVRFDLGWRGYRMAQVDRALRRTAYDIGYKDEMIAVLEAEVTALREGRVEDADLLRKARESASSPAPTTDVPDLLAGADEADDGHDRELDHELTEDELTAAGDPTTAAATEEPSAEEPAGAETGPPVASAADAPAAEAPAPGPAPEEPAPRPPAASERELGGEPEEPTGPEESDARPSAAPGPTVSGRAMKQVRRPARA